MRRPRKKLGKPIGYGRKGTRAVQREIVTLRNISEQLKVAYQFQDIPNAFTLKNQAEQTVEKIAKICRRWPNPACERAPEAIAKMRETASMFARCRCPK